MTAETAAHTVFAALVVVVLLADAWLYRARPDLLARCALFHLPLPDGSVRVDEAMRGLRGDGDTNVRRYGSILVITIRSPWFDRFRLVRPPEILLALDVNEAGEIAGARWLPLRLAPCVVFAGCAGVAVVVVGQSSLLGAALGLLVAWMMLAVVVLAARGSADELVSRVASE